MIQHIKELGLIVIEPGADQQKSLYDTVLSFRDAIEALAVTDFAPAVQVKFMVARTRLGRVLVNGGMPPPAQRNGIVQENITVTEAELTKVLAAVQAKPRTAKLTDQELLGVTGGMSARRKIRATV